MRRCRFPQAPPPLTSITEMDAQVGGRTGKPTGLKDAGDFSPAARRHPLFRPCVTGYSRRQHHFREATALSHNSTLLVSRLGLESFAPSWAVCEPPFSPAAAPFPVTIILSQTLDGCAKAPPAAPLVNWICSRERY